MQNSFFIRSFVKNLRLAQDTAIKKQKLVTVEWRHFKTVVDPSSPKFTIIDMKYRLIDALKDILQIHQLPRFPREEQEVFFFFII